MDDGGADGDIESRHFGWFFLYMLEKQKEEGKDRTGESKRIELGAVREKKKKRQMNTLSGLWVSAVNARHLAWSWWGREAQVGLLESQPGVLKE